MSVTVTERRNLAADPQASALDVGGLINGLGWATARSFGAGGAGTHTVVTGAGPAGLSTWIRKQWTSAATSLANTGLQHCAAAANGTGFFPVRPGQVITVSSYLRCNLNSKAAQVGFYWYDAAGVQIGVADFPSPPVTLPALDWQRIAGTATAPAGAAFLLPVSDITSGTTQNWPLSSRLEGTGLLVEYGGLGDYFDGDSVDTEQLFHSWAATPKGSTSIQNRVVVSTIVVTQLGAPGPFVARDEITWQLGPSFEAPIVQFNGTDGWGVDWVLEGTPEGWNADTVEVQMDNRAGDGAFAGTGRREPRVLTVRGALRGTYAADVEAAVERLKLACECFASDAVLAHSGPAPKYATVRRTGKLLYDFVGRRGATFSFVLTAPDPYKYAAGAGGLVTHSVGLPQLAGLPGITFGPNGSRFPWDFGGGDPQTGRISAVNPGNVCVYPAVVFQGPVVLPELRHLQQSSFMRLNGTLLDGEQVLSDHRNRALTKANSSVFSMRSAGSTFFKLDPGANDLRFTANAFNSTALVIVQYRPRWS